MIYRGKVTRVTGAGADALVYVEVPAIATGYELGPCQLLSPVALLGADPVIVPVPPQVGASVVVAALDSVGDAYAVLGVLPG